MISVVQLINELSRNRPVGTQLRSASTPQKKSPYFVGAIVFFVPPPFGLNLDETCHVRLINYHLPQNRPVGTQLRSASTPQKKLPYFVSAIVFFVSAYLQLNNAYLDPSRRDITSVALAYYVEIAP